MEWHREDVHLTTDPARVDLDMVHGFLRDSYWARGIPREVVARSIAGSIPFSLLGGGRQIGFARVITDRATFAYVADVFVVAEARGRGLARWMMTCVLAHPDVAGVRRWHLVTRDAQPLYASVGFQPIDAAVQHMQKLGPNAYAGG